MADTPKVLGQLNPNATTLTSLYTVPGATNTVVSSVVICNQSSSSTTFRLKVAVANAADNAKQYLYFDLPILGNDTFIATIGITLAATDQMYVYAGTTSLSFNLFGTESS